MVVLYNGCHNTVHKERKEGMEYLNHSHPLSGCIPFGDHKHSKHHVCFLVTFMCCIIYQQMKIMDNWDT